MDRQAHWNFIYGKKDGQEASWFEAFPAASVQWLEAAGLSNETCVLDVGGGGLASRSARAPHRWARARP